MTESTIKAWAELLRSKAFLRWPILALVVASRFEQQIRDILGRLGRGKVLGQDVEPGPSRRDLDERGQAAVSKTSLCSKPQNRHRTHLVMLR
jgi:hypothetical protein